MHYVRLLIFFLLFSLFSPLSAYAQGWKDLVNKELKPETIAYYNYYTRRAFKSGDWKGGWKILNEGLRHFPDNSELNELVGEYYYHHKKYPDARYYLHRALKDNSKNFNARLLLSHVEEETGNWSDAICFLNELLEVRPYDRSFWQRKINLYQRQGNYVQANHLIKRLAHIYPNDDKLQRDYIFNIEKNYQRALKENDKNQAVLLLYELVNAEPHETTYTLKLANLLFELGKIAEAAEVIARGLENNPENVELILKRASILSLLGLYAQAMDFINESIKRTNSPRLVAFKRNLLVETARYESRRDPYTLFGKVYEEQGSQEALDYLLNIALTRGYDEDALYYLREAKKRKGETPSLLYKEYRVYKRMGEKKKANALLDHIYRLSPENADIADELMAIRLEDAGELMVDGLFEDALEPLKFVIANASDRETLKAAESKLFGCYVGMERYADALRLLEELNAGRGGLRSYVIKKADLLRRMNRTPEALDLLEQAADTADADRRGAFAEAFEETSLPFIKSLMEAGALPAALTATERLLRLCPQSEAALGYAIRATAGLRRYDDHDRYVRLARLYYPENTDFLMREASIYDRTRDYQTARELLRPAVLRFPGNEPLLSAFAGHTANHAFSLIKEKQPKEALTILDETLSQVPENRELRYAKGVAYEALRQYDSAYVYQKAYIPGPGEARSHRRHLDGLLARSLKNEIAVDYLYGRYGDKDVITSIATLSYSRKLKHDLLAARINYAGRDGAVKKLSDDEQTPGGIGLQFGAEWEHTFSDRWNAKLGASAATRYFPQFGAHLSATNAVRNDWEWGLHGSYRRIEQYDKLFAFDKEDGNGWVFADWERSYSNLFLLGLHAAKTFNVFRAGLKADALLLNCDFYYNIAADFKYFPTTDGKTSISVTAAVGSAPEASIIDQAMPGTFDKLNANIGLGALYMATPHITLGLFGSWNTFYSQYHGREGTEDTPEDYFSTRYKNLFQVNAQLIFNF